MVTDGAAMAIAIFAQRISMRPPSQRASYGYARAEVLGAFINALLMLGIVAWIAIEAVRRLLAPGQVAGGTVIVVATGGLVVNMCSAWLLMKSSSLNARAALLHVMGDMLGSVAARRLMWCRVAGLGNGFVYSHCSARNGGRLPLGRDL